MRSEPGPLIARNGVSLSVVVPSYDRPESLRACLASLAGQRFPGDGYEVLLVDDGGHQPIVASEPGLRLRCLRQAHAGPAAARNLGASSAQGTHLAFIDDDCTAESDWLCTLAERFSSSPDAMLGGHTLNDLPDSVYSSVSQSIIDYLYAYYHTPLRAGRFLTSNNLALPRARFVELGGFDEGFPRAGAEDRELCERWLQRGWPMHYLPAARVRHAHQLDLVGFLSQHFKYGRGNWRFHAVCEQRSQVYQPAGFYLGLLRHPLRQEAAPRAWLEVGLTAMAQASTAAGFFWEQLRARR